MIVDKPLWLWKGIDILGNLKKKPKKNIGMLSQDMFVLANSFLVQEYPSQFVSSDFSCMIMPF